jgi:hypothetical protein
MNEYSVVQNNSDSTGTIRNLLDPSKIKHLEVTIDDLTTNKKEQKNGAHIYYIKIL